MTATGKFEREDARGIERVLAGIAATHADDVARFARGCILFDELYALAVKETILPGPGERTG
jgi:hypothetical protein